MNFNIFNKNSVYNNRVNKYKDSFDIIEIDYENSNFGKIFYSEMSPFKNTILIGNNSYNMTTSEKDFCKTCTTEHEVNHSFLLADILSLKQRNYRIICDTIFSLSNRVLMSEPENYLFNANELYVEKEALIKSKKLFLDNGFHSSDIDNFFQKRIEYAKQSAKQNYFLNKSDIQNIDTAIILLDDEIHKNPIPYHYSYLSHNFKLVNGKLKIENDEICNYLNTNRESVLWNIKEDSNILIPVDFALSISLINKNNNPDIKEFKELIISRRINLGIEYKTPDYFEDKYRDILTNNISWNPKVDNKEKAQEIHLLDK